MNVDEVVAQRDDEHKASGKRHGDQDQPRVLPGDLSESVHGGGQCNPITPSLISETSAQQSSICGFCPEKFVQLVRPMLAARYGAGRSATGNRGPFDQHYAWPPVDSYPALFRRSIPVLRAARREGNPSSR